MDTMTVKTPWHLWVVGVVSLLWNAVGVYFYVMTVTRNADYLAEMTLAQVNLLTTAPLWSTVAYAIAIWGSIGGALALLLRRRIAVWMFGLALVGFIINAFQIFVLANGAAIVGQGQTIFSVVLAAILLFEVWYAWTMTKRGVLR